MAQEDRKLFWNRENEVDEKWIQFVDDNVHAALPRGTEVTGVFTHGASYWTRTAKIETKQADGSLVSFFIKVGNAHPWRLTPVRGIIVTDRARSIQVVQGDVGRAMVYGEFSSMTTLHNTIPDAIPEPVGWGTYASSPNVHFFLCHFINIIDEVPDIQTFTAKVAELHTKGVSPDGKYGFSVPTFLGQMPQYTAWTDSWEEFFTMSMQHLMAIIEESQGPDVELRMLLGKMISKVIPRLLRPLETGGRQIKPCLVHGDLYSGNVSVDAATGGPILYDAACLYAHNEWDLAPWRLARHKIGKPFMEAYFKHFPIAAPKEDQDDRSILYCLRWDMKGMVIYPGDIRYRTYCIDAMRTLIAKFPEGFEGWAAEKGECPTLSRPGSSSGS